MKVIKKSQIKDAERTKAAVRLAINFILKYDKTLNKPYMKFDIKEEGEQIY